MTTSQPSPKWNAPDGTEPIAVTLDEAQEADADRIAAEASEFRAAMEGNIRAGRDDRISNGDDR